MKDTYTYTGKSNLIFSLQGENYNCISGKSYEFPSNDEYIKTLVSAKLLILAEKEYVKSNSASASSQSRKSAISATDNGNKNNLASSEGDLNKSSTKEI